LEEEHDNLLEYGLEMKKLSPESISYVDTTLYQYSKIGFYDKLALATAKQEGCPLVTGDGALRKAGKNEAVIIFGTVWLIDELISHSIITVDEAKEAYDLMKENGRRLPWKVIDERFDNR
jgi:predicted nucleic acid-binding protein